MNDCVERKLLLLIRKEFTSFDCIQRKIVISIQSRRCCIVVESFRPGQRYAATTLIPQVLSMIDFPIHRTIYTELGLFDNLCCSLVFGCMFNSRIIFIYRSVYSSHHTTAVQSDDISWLLIVKFMHPYIFTALHGMQRGLTMRFLSVRLSVCLSVRHVDCDKTKEKSVQIFIPIRAFQRA